MCITPADTHGGPVPRLLIRRLPVRPYDRKFPHPLHSNHLILGGAILANVLGIKYTGESPINTPWLGVKRVVQPTRQGVRDAVFGEEYERKRRRMAEQRQDGGIDGKV